MTWQPRWFVVLLLCLAAAGCSLNPTRGAGQSRAQANSYVVHGERYYVLDSAEGFVQRGIASWYGRKFHGQRTSSGEVYNMYAMTAAHKRLPMFSRVEVINLANGHRVIVRINDRGPFVDHRIIDLSYAAAKQLGMLRAGTAPVVIRTISAPSMAAASALPEATAKTPVNDSGAQHDTAFFVQVGAFIHPTNAYQLQKRLKAGEFATPVRIEPVDKGVNKYYRVRLGPLRSRAAARRLTRELVAYGINNTRTIEPR